MRAKYLIQIPKRIDKNEFGSLPYLDTMLEIKLICRISEEIEICTCYFSYSLL